MTMANLSSIKKIDLAIFDDVEIIYLCSICSNNKHVAFRTGTVIHTSLIPGAHVSPFELSLKDKKTLSVLFSISIF